MMKSSVEQHGRSDRTDMQIGREGDPQRWPPLSARLERQPPGQNVDTRGGGYPVEQPRGPGERIPMLLYEFREAAQTRKTPSPSGGAQLQHRDRIYYRSPRRI